MKDSEEMEGLERIVKSVVPGSCLKEIIQNRESETPVKYKAELAGEMTQIASLIVGYLLMPLAGIVIYFLGCCEKKLGLDYRN